MRIIALLTVMILISATETYAVEVLIDGKKTDVPVCGGLAGLQCGEEQWCDFPAEFACGVGDHFGTCRSRPEVCTMEFIPVCGCDGKTYGNACEAAAAGFDVAYSDACSPSQ